MAERILLVEDEEKLARMVELELQYEGYEVEKAFDGRTGLELALSGKFDLVLLDIMLPALSGMEVLRRLRKESQMPVIMLTARDTVVDKVSGLDMGADDYVTKPFEPRELLARIAAQLRVHAAQPRSSVLTVGGLRLDTAAHALTVEGTPVRLTKTEYAILKLLMANAGQAIAKSVILDRISADTPDCTESSLKIHVSNLRRKIREACARDCIEAVWGIGFRLAWE